MRPTILAYTNNSSCLTVFCRSLPCTSNLLCPLPAPSSPSQPVQPTNPTSSVICGPTICQDQLQSPRCDTYSRLDPKEIYFKSNIIKYVLLKQSSKNASKIRLRNIPTKLVAKIKLRHILTNLGTEIRLRHIPTNLVAKMTLRHILTNLVTKIRLRHILTNLVTKIRLRRILTNPVLTVLKLAGWKPAMGGPNWSPPRPG